MKDEQNATEEYPAEEPTASDGTANEPTDSSQNTPADSGNGDNFNTYDSTEQQQTTASYVLNTSSLKIHYPTCRDVKKIAPQNYSTSNLSLEELLSQGYSTCGHCFR